jgi:WD40 repeat protein
MKKGKLLHSHPVKTSGTVPTMPLAFSGDGRFLVFGHAARLSVWDLEAKQIAGELQQEKKHFQDAAFAPHGPFLATVSNEETVKYWDTATWQVIQTFDWEIGKLKCVTFAPDGMRGATGGDKGQIVVWDVD